MRTILDTRDLQKRLDELEGLRDALDNAKQELSEFTPEGEEETEEETEERENLQSAVGDAEFEFSDDEKAELAELETLQNECDFRHGESLIPVDDFEDYARQIAEDIGAIPDDNQWPCTCIDWEQAAKELAQDYTEVEYQGTSYYVRA